jgi:hypothetical protein
MNTIYLVWRNDRKFHFELGIVLIVRFLDKNMDLTLGHQ